MNVQALLLAVLLWVASVAGSYFYGTNVGATGEVAKQLTMEKAIEETRKVVLKETANAIANIRVHNTTVQGRVETIVRDNPVYRDCQHDPDGLRLINEALSGRSGPAGTGSVP